MTNEISDDHTESERAEFLWKARAELAEAELAKERARLDWLEKVNSSKFSPLWDQDWIHIRSAIDQAMKEESK